MQRIHNLGRHAWILVFFWPVILLGIYGNQFIYMPGTQYSDLVISHLPNAIFLKATLAAGQGIPFWSPTILSGYPFYANPLSGLYYPPGWLTLVLPWAFGFNLLFVAHLVFGGIGLFLFLRAEGISRPAALLGGLLFETLPKLLAHFEAGHVTLVYAVCWTPWLLLSARVWGNQGWGSRRAFQNLWRAPGIILGLIFLIDSRWAAFAGLIWLAYTLLVVGGKPYVAASDQANPLFSSSRLFLLGKVIAMILGQVILAGFIAAPLAIPLLQYAHLSSRASLSPDEAFTLSLPPARLLGLVFPDIQGTAEWIFYPGCFGLTFAVVALSSRRLRARARFWLWLAAVSLVYSLGSFIPGLKYIAYLPGFDLLRVPARALFATGLALAIVSAMAADGLAQQPFVSFFTRKRDPRLSLAGVAFFALALAFGASVLAHTFLFTWWWGAGCLAIGVAWISLRLAGKLGPRLWISGVFVIALINTGVIALMSISPHSPESVLNEQAAVVNYIKKQPGGIFRIYSPSYSLPQQVAALAHLELADGIDPLQLATYDRWLSSASGVPADGYSVTQPPFKSGDPAVDNRSYVPDPVRLGWLNVKYVIAEYDLKPVAGLALIQQIGTTRIYVNHDVLPRAWVQADSASTPGLIDAASVRPAAITRYLPDEIDLNASGPGELVTSEVSYPGWEVWVDGRAGTLNSLYNLFRSVDLPAGQHTVVFKFIPYPLYIGCGLFLIPWLTWLISQISRARRMADQPDRSRQPS